MNIFKQKLIQKLDALSLNISALGSSACASINKFQVLKFSIPFLKVLISLLLFSYFIEITINLVNYFDLIDLSKDSILNVNGNSGDGGDKVIVDISADVPRAWPSGVPQSFALFSTVYATYSALAKLSALSPMQRMVASMSSAGVSLTVMSYFAAVENPKGFHTFAYLISQYKETGKIPSPYEMRSGTTSSLAKNIVDTPATSSFQDTDSAKLSQAVEDLKAFYTSRNESESIKPTSTLNDFLVEKGYPKTTLSKEDWLSFHADLAKKCVVKDPSDNNSTKTYSVEDILTSSNDAPAIKNIESVSNSTSSSTVSASNTNTDSVPSTAVRQADTGVDMEPSSSSDISSGNNFIPEDSSLNDFILNKFFKLFELVMDYLKPVDVSGHLDDLIGQRIFIEFILLVMCVFVTLLFTIFIINIIYFLNKDKIIKLFNNKYINMLIKYQNFVIKFNLIYIPIFIGIGLFTILNGLIWLITHPIPYTSLDIDLHQFISSKNLLLFLSMTPYGCQSLKTKHINNNYIRLACSTSQRQG
jgi:hypothetical protein